MKISIKKESSVPLRDQLVEQISLQIASGSLESETKLPSIRALAGRLDIHYSTVTAAYNHLADVGLLEIRQGSGVRVAKIDNVRANTEDLNSLFMSFLSNCCKAGHSFDDVLKVIDVLNKREKVEQILAVDQNKDFHSVITSELKPYFDLPVNAITTEELLANPKEALSNSLIVTSLYHIFKFQNVIEDRTRLVPCNIEPARQEMDKVKEMKTGSILLLVSVSETLMNMATKLVAAQRGEEVAVRSVLLNDEKELEYMVGFADLILCDTPSESRMNKLTQGNKLKCFKLYSPNTISLIKDRLSKWG